MVAVIELSNASWLVAGTLPGVARRPLKKLDPDPSPLQQLLTRWRIEAEGAGRSISRMIVAYEAGRDGFWRLLYIPRSRPAMVTVGLYR